MDAPGGWGVGARLSAHLRRISDHSRGAERPEVHLNFSDEELLNIVGEASHVI